MKLKLYILPSVLFILMLSPYVKNSEAVCAGKFVNPISSPWWPAMFPIKIAGITIVPSAEGKAMEEGGKAFKGLSSAKGVDSGSSDGVKDVNSPICVCKGNPIPRIGIPISFYEPARVMESVIDPWCFPSLGGLNLASNSALVFSGGSTGSRPTGSQSDSKAFMNVHYVSYPLFTILNILTDVLCLQFDPSDFALLGVTEIDPLWMSDELTNLLNPEVLLFANPISQMACGLDCAVSSFGVSKVSDAMFWCAGCWGSIYPLNGHSVGNNSPAQAGALVSARFLGMAHRMLIEWGTTGVKGLCGKYPMPIMRKSQYKFNMFWPRLTNDFRIGTTENRWGLATTVPGWGENYGYILWRKRDCCFL